jgi:hypothetical protein
MTDLKLQRSEFIGKLVWDRLLEFTKKEKKSTAKG